MTKILAKKIVSLFTIFFSKIVYLYRFKRYIFEYRCPPLITCHFRFLGSRAKVRVQYTISERTRQQFFIQIIFVNFHICLHIQEVILQFFVAVYSGESPTAAPFFVYSKRC